MGWGLQELCEGVAATLRLGATSVPSGAGATRPAAVPAPSPCPAGCQAGCAALQATRRTPLGLLGPLAIIPARDPGPT